MNAPAVLELPLDDNLLKVLSSESRREILRLLVERRMTGAELATRLDLGKPAVAEHLKKLQDSELIERFDDPERRWVYYGLSHRGRSILEPSKVRFYLVLAVAAIGLMLGMALALGIVAFLQSHDSGALAPAVGGHHGADAALGTVPGQAANTAFTKSATTAPNPATAGGPAAGNVVLDSHDVNPGPALAAPVVVDNITYQLILPNAQPLTAEALRQHNLYVQRLDVINHTIVVNVVQGADLDALATLSNQTLHSLANNRTTGAPVAPSTPQLTFSVSVATGTNHSNATVVVTPRANLTAVPPANATVTSPTLNTTIRQPTVPLANVTAVTPANSTAPAAPTLGNATVIQPTLNTTMTSPAPAATTNSMEANQPAPCQPSLDDCRYLFWEATGTTAPSPSVAATFSTTTTAPPHSILTGNQASGAQGQPAQGSAALNGQAGLTQVASQIPRDNTFASVIAFLSAAVFVALVRARRA